jgi:hypothetical protein
MELRHEPVEHQDVEASPELQALLAWAQANGVVSPKLKYPVHFPPGYPGALATELIQPHETIVQVPMSLLLNAEKGELSPIAPVYQEFPAVFQDHPSKDMFKLVAYIIYELGKGEESFWAPFLKTFPKDVEVLSDWNEEELEELEDLFLSSEVASRKALLQGEWEVLKPALEQHSEWFPSALVNYETYFWLWKISLTRAFGRFKPSPSLIPVAEYVNHEFAYTHYIIGSPESTFRGFPLFDDYDHPQLDPEVCQEPYPLLELTKLHLTLAGRVEDSAQGKDQVEMLETWCNAVSAAAPNAGAEASAHSVFTALETESKEDQEMVFRLVSGENEYYEPGSQLFLFYGQYSNRQLLLNYGFTLPFNVYNFALVFLNLKQFANKFPRLSEADPGKYLVFKMRELQLCTGTSYLAFINTVRALYWDPNNQLATDLIKGFSYPHEAAVLMACKEIVTLYLKS